MAKHQAFRHCPMCGTPLQHIERTGALRPVCPGCDYTVYYDPKVAVVVRVTYQATVLLIKRGVDPEKGKWALPAGFVNAGEAPANAARREIFEETRLQLDKLKLLDVFANPGDGTADIIIAYGTNLDQPGQVTPNDDAIDAAFFHRQHLPSTAFKTTTWLIQNWIEKL